MFTKEVAPYIQEVPDKGLDPYKLLNETVVRSVIVSATWDQKAKMAYKNGAKMLVYVYPDENTLDQNAFDWSIQLMIKIVKQMYRSNDMSLVPIFAKHSKIKDTLNIQQE